MHATDIDGHYQCNRNRRNIKFPDDDAPASLTVVDFKVYQKETKTKDGMMRIQEWRFANINEGNKFLPHIQNILLISS